MKKVKMRSCLYLILTVILCLVTLLNAQCNVAGKVILILFFVLIYFVSYYDIGLNGDKYTKAEEADLYENLHRNNFDGKPVFAASQLIFSGQVRKYPKMKELVIAAVFYYLQVIITLISILYLILG